MQSERLSVLADKIRRAAGQKELLEQQLVEAEARSKQAEQRYQDAGMAKELVLQVAERTQINIGNRISDLVSLALASVFEDAYGLRVDFVQRRGTTEADIWFTRHGHLADPMTASGGGAIDIAAFALRLAVWSLAKSRPLFILDEPFRNLSLDLQGKAGIMLRELSRQLGLQIVMVSHNPEIISGADRVFRLLPSGRLEVQD